jgi:general stress protein 26
VLKGTGVTPQENKLSVVWSLMQEIKVPMVVTHDGDNGEMRARPMAAHPDPDANAIFFLTDVEATKDKEIYRNDNVCLVFSDIRKQHYVSLTGRAER